MTNNMPRALYRNAAREYLDHVECATNCAMRDAKNNEHMSYHTARANEWCREYVRWLRIAHRARWFEV